MDKYIAQKMKTDTSVNNNQRQPLQSIIDSMIDLDYTHQVINIPGIYVNYLGKHYTADNRLFITDTISPSLSALAILNVLLKPFITPGLHVYR